MCVCVCVCVRERERERERVGGRKCRKIVWDKCSENNINSWKQRDILEESEKERKKESKMKENETRNRRTAIKEDIYGWINTVRIKSIQGDRERYRKRERKKER